MGSKTPTTGTAEPQDDLVVALPPEILAMMAASDASLAAAGDAEAAEADDAAALSAESGEAAEADDLASAPALDASDDVVEDASDETALVAAETADADDATDLTDANPREPAELAGAAEDDAPPADLDAQMALLLASVGALPAGAAAPETSAPAALPAEPAENEALLSLPAVLDLTAAGALHAALLNHRGTPLALDAGEVKRLGGQCLQLLLSADRTWAADGVPIRLQGASEAFDRDLGFMGLSRDDLFQRTAA